MPRHYPVDDLTGQVFGRLTAISRERLEHQRWGWLCRCECGNEKVYKTSSLTRGASRSCGCLQAELTRERSVRHGMSQTRVHRIWRNMKTRCENQNFPGHKDYGARGVKVCERWQTFENFLADMGEPPPGRYSIDRFPDVNGDYEPGNARWADDTQQGRNKRNNHVLEFRGESRPASEWAEITGIHYQTILYRLRIGWSVEKALTEPADQSRSRKRIKTE